MTTTRVTRALIAREAEKIFANSPGYNVAVDMAGREAALRKLNAIVAGEGSSQVGRVSDLLGAGKTFFLQWAINGLGKSGAINEATEVLHTDYRDLGDMSAIEASSVKLLIVDELDRKAPRDALLTAVEAAARWRRDDRVVILTGDFVLKHPDITAVIDVPEPVDLDPLEEVLFLRAITTRLDRSLRQLHPDGDTADEAADAAAHLFDPELLSVLLPDTDPPVATFREVLGLVQKLAGVLPIDEKPCVFTPDTFREFASHEGSRRRPAAQVEFIENLYAEIRARAASGVPWSQMHIQEFPWLTDLSEDAALAYERDVVDPLIRAKLLLPMGVPYMEPHGRRTPGPYVPTVRAFLNARFLDAPVG